MTKKATSHVARRDPARQMRLSKETIRDLNMRPQPTEIKGGATGRSLGCLPPLTQLPSVCVRCTNL